MTSESALIASLRSLATDPAARGLMDDAAVLEMGGRSLVLTHDMIVEGVHFLPNDPPGDVAWKLLAVNLSDLAAKGAYPIGALLGYSLGDDGWDAAFVAGLALAMQAFGVPLLGGDTVQPPKGAPRTLGLTLIGETTGPVPSRAGAREGDILWASGAIGDAGAGLAIAKGERKGSINLVHRYQRPRPRLEAGQALAPIVSAMMDISDGLLIDAKRMAEASGLAARIELDAIPLSADYIDAMGDGRQARIAAVSAGDDYELLFAASRDHAAEILVLAERLGLSLSRIGRMEEGAGLALTHHGDAVEIPAFIGWEHGISGSKS